MGDGPTNRRAEFGALGADVLLRGQAVFGLM
jgi:hypothetical protein